MKDEGSGLQVLCVAARFHWSNDDSQTSVFKQIIVFAVVIYI